MGKALDFFVGAYVVLLGLMTAVIIGALAFRYITVSVDLYNLRACKQTHNVQHCERVYVPVDE